MPLDLTFSRVGFSDQFPVSLEDAKDHLRVDFNDDDERIKKLIKSVSAEAQKFTGKPVFETIWQTAPGLIDIVSLIKLPFVQSVSVKDAITGDEIPSSLGGTTAETSLTLDAAYAAQVKVSLLQQYVSEDLELSLLLMVAFYYERRDLSRFSEQTLASLRKRLLYHRDSVIVSQVE